MKSRIKDYIYYSDLYDKLTIKECRRLVKRDPQTVKKELLKIKNKKKQEEYFATKNAVDNVLLYFYKGEHYLKKKVTIDKWIERDKQQDELYSNAQMPQNVRCDQCHHIMEFVIKSLENDYKEGQVDRVLFIFTCPSCQDKKGIYNNGDLWSKPERICEKCGSVCEVKHSRKGMIITTIETCTMCGHKTKDQIDLTVKKEKEVIDPHFEEDRKKFCLTEEEGQKFILAKANIEQFTCTMEKIKEKEDNKELYNKVAKLKKLKVPELKELLIKTLAKEKYMNLQFGSPDMSRYVTLPFTVEDTQSNREEYDSSQQLKKLINASLKNTNWRLMSDGINYRLGILSVRVKAYEQEEDLLKIIN